MTGRPVVAVETGSQVDLARWEREYAAGERADRTPYGLDRMTGFGVGVRTRGGVGRPVRAALRGLLGCTRLDLAALLRRGHADVLLTQHEKHGVPAVLASLLPGRPPVVTGVIWLTDDSADVPPALRRLLIGLLSRAGAVFVLSRAQLPVVRSWGVPPERARFVAFGVNVDFWCPGQDGAEPGLVLSAGTDRDRDHPTLLAGLALVPGARLHLAGAHLPGAHVTGAQLLGRLSHADLRAAYRRAAVVAVATRPNLHVSGVTVVLEAMACGVPVVVTDSPGMADYVEHGVTGLLVPTADPAALAAAVGSLLADPARARAMGRAARAAVVGQFCADRYAARLAGLCREVAR